MGSPGYAAAIHIFELCVFLEAICSLQDTYAPCGFPRPHGILDFVGSLSGVKALAHPSCGEKSDGPQRDHERKRPVPGLCRAGPNAASGHVPDAQAGAADGGLKWAYNQTGLDTVSLARPRARRRASTLRPFLVAMRARKPCTFTRWRFLGWYVLTEEAISFTLSFSDKKIA